MSAFVKLVDVNGDFVWVRRTAIVRIEPRIKRGTYVTFADGGHIETADDADTVLKGLEEADEMRSEYDLSTLSPRKGGD
jgi:hypothetical protein